MHSTLHNMHNASIKCSEITNFLLNASGTMIEFASMGLLTLLNQYFREHSQAELANNIGVTQSIVSRWKNNQETPNFENCLRLAKELNKSPLEIFDAIGSEKFAELFKSFLPEYEPKPAPEADAICCEKHRELHRMLNSIMHSKRKDAAFWQTGIISNLVSMSSSATAKTKSGRTQPAATDNVSVEHAGTLIPDEIIDKLSGGNLQRHSRRKRRGDRGTE